MKLFMEKEKVQESLEHLSLLYDIYDESVWIVRTGAISSVSDFCLFFSES